MEQEKTDKKKLNRLVILGNGFDLSLGMKTSYKDFMYNYLRDTLIQIYKDDESDRGKYQQGSSLVYDDGLTNWRVPETETPFTILRVISLFNNYDKLSKFLIDSKYLKYSFDLLTEFHDNSVNGNWTDIEILYYDSIVKLVKKYSGGITREQLLKEYNSKFNKLRLELINYLSTVKPPWLKGERKKDYLKIIPNHSMGLYYKIFESINGENEVDEVMILNFNYTNTLDLIHVYLPINFVPNITHIHGRIIQMDSVIFGFGDELDKDYLMLESVRSSELFRYIKSPHYFQSPRYKELNKFINQGEYEVYIMGHSCGISDRTLLNEIFENKDCKSIRIFYHEREDLSNNKLDSSIEIMKHFTDKKRMRKIIKDFTDDDKMVQLKI